MGKVKLVQDVAYVSLHRLVADYEPVCDFLVAQTAGNQLDYLGLTWRQLLLK